MKSLVLYLLFGFQFFTLTGLLAQHKIAVEKEPSWVTINSFNYNNPQLEADAENGYIDVDYEEQVLLSAQSRYYKKSIKILSEAGVENSSEVSVTYDPTYEQLAFHSISVIRDGKATNKLQPSKFKIIQQEKELSMHMYDGSLTAYLLLEDVRKGDVVEYSYTLKGFNPIFSGKYAETYDCQYSVPIANLYYKLVVPAGRNIHIKNSNTTIVPQVSNQVNQTTYEWKVGNVAALHLEAKTPGWFDPFATVMVSEYNNWNEVSTWAADLFPHIQQLSPALQKKVDNIRTVNTTNDERILASLQFVQDDIRYMGIEMGTGSHKPSHPDKIFAQRFGDCKDKSYLLVSMLNAMGIEACPILINTVDKRTINDWLPAANLFDHVTVQVKNQGKTYYFDPTISLQRGTISNISYPDYQTGLLVNKSATDLTQIPFHEPGLADIKEIFTMPDMTGKATFKVITKNTGSFADNARSDFNYNSVYELKNKYKDFYAAYFEKITADSLTYTDDPVTGEFNTTEYYSINDIWKTDDGAKKSTFSSFVINSIMTKPSDQNRKMPFYLVYPAHYKEQLEINLPEEWSVKPFDQKVQCPEFTLLANGQSNGSRITLNYEYENLKDHVEPNDAANFFANYNTANDATGYSLTYKKNEAASAYNSAVSADALGTFPKLYIILGLCVVLTFLIRRQRQKQY